MTLLLDLNVIKEKVLEKINLDKIEFVGYAFQIEMKFTS